MSFLKSLQESNILLEIGDSCNIHFLLDLEEFLEKCSKFKHFTFF